MIHKQTPSLDTETITGADFMRSSVDPISVASIGEIEKEDRLFE